MVAGAILQWFYQKDDLFREKTLFSISSLEKAMFHPGAYKLLVFCFSRNILEYNRIFIVYSIKRREERAKRENHKCLQAQTSASKEKT